MPAAAANRTRVSRTSSHSLQAHPQSSRVTHSSAFPKSNHQKNLQLRGAYKSNKHMWTNKGCKLGGQQIQVDEQQIVRMRDQRIAVINSTQARPASTATPPPASTSPPTTASGPALPLFSSSTSSLSAVPNIPVHNRFGLFSEEGNQHLKSLL